MIERQKQDEYPNDSHDDEIDLSEIWAVLVKFKKLILLSMLIVAILAAGLSLLMPNVYRAEVLLAPTSTADSKSGIASALGGLGGLASMAGLSLGGGGSLEESLAVLQSREFLWQFVQKNTLMPILFEGDWDAKKKRWITDDPKNQPNQWDVYRLFIKKGTLDVSVDKKSGLVTVGIEWTDAEVAALWANNLVKELNQYLAKQSIVRSERNLKYLNEELSRTQVEEMRKVLFDMISSEQKNAMMANTQKEFAFKVLDPAAEPDKKIKPKRSLIVVLAAVLAGFVAAIYAFVSEARVRRYENRVEIINC